MSIDPQESPEAEVRRWAAAFDGMATAYDQSGVPFYGTIAQGLVDHLAIAPGERVLDLGAGRGAVTLRAAELVGPTGRVEALDIAPTMVELTARAARERGLDQVHVRVGDATDPGGVPGSYDVLAASLVVFFLPDPEEALRGWLPLLAPGGRLGLSTFRPWPPSWRAVVDAFLEHAEPTGRPAPTDMPAVFADDDAVADLVARAGGRGVRTEVATYDVPFTDLDQWRVWSLGTVLRGLWFRTAEEAHPAILARVGEILDANDGRLEVSVRYTLATA